MYVVLARKWRPATFSELVGQSHVAETLENEIRSGRIAHAYLFAGVRGTGKTSVARIFAKCLNCESGPTAKPCDACDACREIAASQAIDVLEIDAASRTKVEQTRELLEVVSYAPARDRYKILIVDEVHMLSKASFNALLKTIEEPPPNVVFVLATTELQRVLPTIVSRCQLFEFRRVSAGELTEHLGRICSAESIEISPSALERIARAGEGSVRDALSILERVIAFCGTTVEDDEVLRLLGAVRNEILTGLVRGMAERDPAALLAVFQQVADEGHDLVQFWNEVIAVIRDLLLERSVPGRLDLIGRPAEEMRALAEAAEPLTPEDLSRVFQILAGLEPALKTSARPRFLFEAALIRIAGLGAVRPIEELLAGLGGADPETGGGAAPAGEGSSGGTPRAPRPATRPPSPPRRRSAPAEPPEPEAESPPIAARPEPAPGPAAERPAGDDALLRGLREAVQHERPMLGAVLDEATAAHIDGNQLRVWYPRGKEFLGRQLLRDEHRDLVRACVKRTAGRDLRIAIETAAAGAPDSRAASSGPTRGAAAGREDGERAGAGRAGAADRDALLEQARSEPGVSRLLREFGARVVEIRPAQSKETP